MKVEITGMCGFCDSN